MIVCAPDGCMDFRRSGGIDPCLPTTFSVVSCFLRQAQDDISGSTVGKQTSKGLFIFFASCYY